MDPTIAEHVSKLFNNENKDDDCLKQSMGRVSEGLHSRQILIADLIECDTVRQGLTNSDVAIRGHALLVLSDIIATVGPSYLAHNEVRFLVVFMCDRLKDHFSMLGPSLQSITALVHCENLDKEDVQHIVRQTFTNISLPTQLTVHRRTVYNLLSYLLDHHLSALLGMGTEFVYNFIQAVDGEKEPRNLMLMFNLVAVVSSQFPIDNFVEDLFEVTACYFPVDFTPPADNQHDITRDSLSAALRVSMCSTPKFAKFCLPLLIEKLSSEVKIAKVDSLRSLVECLKIYQFNIIEEYFNSLWDLLKVEVFHTADETIEELALDAVELLMISVSRQIFNLGALNNLQTYINIILKDCKCHICEPDLKLVWPSAKILQKVTGASDPVCCTVLQTVLPLLRTQYHNMSMVNQKRIILEIYIGFITAVRNSLHVIEVPTAMTSDKEEFLGLLLSNLNGSEVKLKPASIAGVAALLSIQGLLVQSEIQQIITCILHIALDTDTLNTDISFIRKEALSTLSFLGLKYPDAVKETMLPTLLKKREGGVDTGPVLSALTAISTSFDIIIETVPIILDNIDTDVEIETALDCLLDIAKTCLKSDRQCRQYFCDDVIRTLLTIAIKRSETDTTGTETETVQKFAVILRTVVQQLDDDFSQSVVDLTMETLIPQWTAEQTSVAVSDSSTLKLLTLVSSLLCSLPRTVPVPNFREISSKLLQEALHNQDQNSSTTASKCLAGLLNKKHKTDPGLSDVLKQINDSINKILNNNNDVIIEKCGKSRAMCLLIWVTKAVVLQAHPTVGELSGQLIRLFSDPLLGDVAASGFYIILSDSEDVMSKAMHADIKLMYKQRFFSLTLPGVVAGFKNSQPDFKSNYLNALSHLLHFIPKQILLAELPPLFPLLLHSLQLEDNATLRLSTLNTFYLLIHDAPNVLAGHVETLITNFLHVADYKHSMTVRIAAVECVGAMSLLPPALITPYRHDVIRKLSLCVDDRKRLVRKAAAVARCEWCLLGTK